MKRLNVYSRSLVIAGALAVTVAGCGKEAPKNLIDSANAFAAKGDYSAAAIQLRNLLQQQPENGQARFLLGAALSEQRDFVTAEKEFRKALEYGYAPDGVYAALAHAVLGQGNGKDLVAEFGVRNLADPQAQASLRSDVGLAYLALGQRDAARRSFDAALAAKPGHGLARVGLGLLAASGGDLEGAMKTVDEVLASSPTLAEAWQLKADLLLARDDVPGAVKCVEEVVRIQPNNVAAHAELATLRVRGGKLDEAAAGVAEMRKKFARDAQVPYLEAMIAFRRGNPAATRDAIQEALKAAPDHAPSLYLAGAADYRLRSFDTAAEYLRRALAKYPRSAGTQRLLISAHLDGGHPERAVDVVDAALRGQPDDPRVLTLAGAVALANNDAAKAARYYERATAIDKDNATVRTRLGQARFAAGDVDRGMRDLESASALDSAGYQADLALISAHLRRKEFDKALAVARTLEKKQPGNPLTYNVKGIVLGASGDLKSARASFLKALDLQFDYLPAAANLARLDIADKNPEAARGRLEAIIAKAPGNAEALIALAELKAATRMPPKEVTATFERAVAADPASIRAKLALAGYQLNRGDARSALAILQGAAAGNPDDTRVLALLGAAQQETGETNQAIATFNKLASLQPRSPDPLMRVAALHFAAKDYDASLRALQRALALQPDSLEIRAEIIGVRLASGKTDTALAEARAIQSERPKQAIGFVLEGDVHTAQQKWDPAAGAYREAMKRQPTSIVLARLHATLQNQGKTEDANRLVAGWLRDNPKDTAVRTYLGNRALQDKDFKEAARLYKEVLALQPETPLVLNNLAWASGQTKDPAALGYAERAYALSPESSSILDTYGWLLLQNGDVKRSVELLTAAVSRSPKSPLLRLHLAQALIAAADKPGARKEIEALLALEASAEQRAEAEGLMRGL